MESYIDSFAIPFFLGAFLGTATIFWKLFDRADLALSDEGRAKIGSWISSLNEPKNILQFPSHFSNIFDSVFGKNHLSLRCFIISVLISFLLSTILSAILLAENFTQLMANRGYIGSSGFHWDSAIEMITSNYSKNNLQEETDIIIFIKTFFCLFFLVNIPSDYLSLLQTRYILKLMDKTNKKISLFYLAILDFFLNVIIFFIFYIPVLYFIIGPYFSVIPTIGASLETYFHLIKSIFTFDYHVDFAISTYAKIEASPTSFFYSTWFTSIWLYLFLVSSVIIWPIKLFCTTFFNFRRYSDIKKRPLQFISIIITILIFLIYLLMYIIYLTNHN